MPILHMETDMVRGVGNQLQQTADHMLEHTQQLNTTIQSLSSNWQGPSADIFISDIHPVLQQLNQLFDTGTTLNHRLQREVDEWLQVDISLGSTIAPSSGVMAGNYQPGTSDYLANSPEPSSAIALQNEYYQLFNQMQSELDELNRLYNELETERQEMIERGFGNAIEMIKNVLKTGQTPTPIQVLSLVGQSSFKSLIYAKDAIEWGFNNMKYTDMLNDFRSSQSERYNLLGQLATQIQKVDPTWTHPSIYSTLNNDQ